MPKMKTHSGAKKRVKVTAGGKLMRQQTNMRHNLEGKPTSRTRRLNVDAAVSPADTKKIKRQLGL